MKLYFKNANEVKEGILLLEEELSMTACFEDCDDADCTVFVEKAEERIVTVTLDGKEATITYGDGIARFFRGLGHLASWLSDGITEKTLTEIPTFETNGAMLDVEGGAVVTPKMMENMFRKVALMGLNTYMLYTEDLYEIEGRPYFGHLRGRYTKQEIKDMDAYALKLGIELIPCIQLLGHLGCTLHWAAHAAVRDTADCLLVGAEETYKFIDDMLKTVAECFTSRKLHMGMDETHSLGTGAYRARFGERPRREIYLEHLHRVVPMVKSYGFTPMMWSDMFFKSNDPEAGDYSLSVELPPNAKEMVPEGITQVYWDYYHTDKNFYRVNIDRHKEISDHTIFAGGVWSWCSYMMQHIRTLRYSIPGLEVCKEKGVKDVLATIWHSNFGSAFNSLIGLAVYAEFDYKGKYDENDVRECVKRTCHTDYDKFMLIEKLEYGHGDDRTHGISSLLVYNDPLQGQFDRHLTPYDLKTYYTNLAEEIGKMDFEDNVFTPAFKFAYALGDVLQYKADFGLRLKKAYDEKDMAGLREMLDVAKIILEKLVALRRAHLDMWKAYYKTFTWKVLDMRYGGIIARQQTTVELLSDYIAGKIDHLEEVEAERLWFDTPNREGRNPDEPDLNIFWYSTMHKIHGF